MNILKTGMLLAAMTALFLGVGYLIGGATGMVIALAFAVATNAYAYWNSDTLALRMSRARPVTRAEAPGFVGLVEGLAQNAGLPMPKTYVIDSDQPNAFATGRNPENAAVAATTGLIRMLTREELAGVMAHELAHVKNRDTLTMTIAATVAGAIAMLAQFGFFFGMGRDRGGLGIVGVLLMVIVAPMAAMLIQMTISRTREYSADRLGGEICGDPLALASALRKISGGAKRAEMPAVERNPAFAHLFIVNPLSGARMDNLFSTHPSTENRIAALRQQAAEMGQGPAGVPEGRPRGWASPPRTGGRQGPWG